MRDCFQKGKRLVDPNVTSFRPALRRVTNDRHTTCELIATLINLTTFRLAPRPSVVFPRSDEWSMAPEVVSTFQPLGA